MCIKMLKIKFEIAEPEKIAEWIFYEFKDAIINNPPGILGQIIFLDIQESIKKQIIREDFLTENLRLEIVNEIKKTMPTDELIKLKEKIIKRWEKDGEKIIGEIEKITEQKFYQDEITCFITNAICSSHVSNNIILGFKDVPKDTLDIPDFILLIIGEELLHVHYIDILHHMPELASKNFDEYKEWQVSEVLPEFILLENEDLSYLEEGPIKNRYLYYPWISEVKEKIRSFWINRKSFKDFVLKVYSSYNSL